MINELKDNPNAMIQDSFVKNANIKIDYSGSRFMNAVKEVNYHVKVDSIREKCILIVESG